MNTMDKNTIIFKCCNYVGISNKRERELLILQRASNVRYFKIIEHWSLEYWTESLTPGIILGSQILQIISSDVVVSMIGEERKLLIWEKGSNTNLIEIIRIVDSLTLQLIYSTSHTFDIIFGTKDS